MQGVWDTLKEKKRRRKETKAIWPCRELKQTESHSAILCEFQSEQETQKRESFNLRGAFRKDREKHCESVRE